MTGRRRQTPQGCPQIGAQLVGQQFAARAPIIANRRRAAYRLQSRHGVRLVDIERRREFDRRLMLDRIGQSSRRHTKSARDLGHYYSLFAQKLHSHTYPSQPVQQQAVYQ